MRILLLGVAAVALSGCSWLGAGKSNQTLQNSYHAKTGDYRYRPAAPVKPSCKKENCFSRWNFEAAVGPSLIVRGDATTAEQQHPSFLGMPQTVKMKDAYKTGFRAELGGSYALSPNRKITATSFIDQAKSAGPQVSGSFFGGDLSTELSDYKSYGGELGLRQYFSPLGVPVIKSIRPYVEAKGGAAYVQAIRANETGGFPSPTVPFYKASVVGTAAGMVGVEVPVAKYTTFGLETGVRYTQSPKSDTSVLNSTHNLAGANNGGSRVSVPVMLRGRYRF